jgi:hypothetical protein
MGTWTFLFGLGINRLGHCKMGSGNNYRKTGRHQVLHKFVGYFHICNILTAFFLVKIIMTINMKQGEEIPNSFKYQACVGGHQN